MMKRTIAAALLALTLSAAPQATTCAGPNNIPPGTAVTPDCTYIVEQVDPGVWRDQLGQVWTFIAGFSNAVKVKLEDLHIGRWLTGR